MKKTKIFLAICIIMAILITNCYALLSNKVYADNVIAIHFDTPNYTTNTAKFTVGGVETTVTIKGTESTIHEDGDNCGIGFTEPLGSTVTLQVDEKYNPETMEIYAEEPSENGFFHNLPVNNERYIQFSGTEIDNQTGQPRDWGTPNDFHFGIREKGGNNGGGNLGQHNVVISFDTDTANANTVAFNVDGVETKLTVSGEGLSIEPDAHGARLEIPESLKNVFKLQVDDKYNPETMEIYACDGGDDAFTEILSIDENRYVVFPESLITRGRFHFGIAGKGFSPVNMVTLTIVANGGIALEGYQEVIHDVPTGQEFVVQPEDLCIKAPACYEFAGWKIGETIYAPNEPVSFTENLTVIPQWKKISHTPKVAVKENEKNATCKVEGSYDEVIYCSVCGEEISRTKKTIEKKSHTTTDQTITNIKKATLSNDGVINKSIESKCSVCGDVIGKREETVAIPYPKTIALSKTDFTYNNKLQKPTIKVAGSDGKVIDSSNYEMKYSNKSSKKIGEYKVTINFKGNYEGTKTLKYKIIPKGTSLKKLTTGKKQFKATWKAQKTQTTGYEVQYSTNKKFKPENKKVNIKKNKTTSSTVNKLKAKKKYYVRIRTYKTVNGKKYYSGWSKVLNVKTKK